MSIAAGNVDANTSSTELAAGTGPNQAARARVLTDRGVPLFDEAVFAGFHGGVNVALGDVDGDGRDDLIVAAGPGGGPHVRVYRVRDGVELASFFAYSPAFSGGVNVAAADLDGDGDDEIITGTGPGGGPHVRTFNGNGAATDNGFFAYDPAFRGGVNVAGADLQSDTRAEIITGAGSGGGPHVGVFTATGSAITGFFAYDAAYTGGLYVAAGQREIATGTINGGPHVKLFDPNGLAVSSFHAYDTGNTGVRVALR